MTLSWTRITDPDDAVKMLPAWVGVRMIGLRGRFGLLLTSGDVLRCTSIVAAYVSTTGMHLIDVMLDSAGVPEGVDEAWWSKHYLGVPVPAATLATVNLAHVIAAVEFVAAEMAEQSADENVPSFDEMSEPAEESQNSDAVAQMVERSRTPVQ